MLNMADEVNSHENDLESNQNKNIHTNEFIKQRNSSGGEVHEKQKPPPIDANEASSNSFTGNGGPKTPLPFSTLERKRAERERKIGHRRVDQTGQVTYKKIETSQICGSIQLGIGYAVGSISSKPERDLLMQDFAMVETTSFPKEGSNITPAHHYSDFKFKTYAPVAFRYFRDLFGIQPDDFLLSVCNEPMRELSNPGASGSVFYLTADDEFILKTVQHKEADFLQKLLPGYYMNLNQNKCTLLPKFFGLYCYLCGGKNVRLISMNNILPTSIRMHEKYDLKGSTYKRRASKYEKSKNSPTYKDLDFIEINPEGILLEAETYSALVKTIQRDCRVLESFKIMDYSLLMGIHNLDLAAKEKQEKLRERMANVAKEAAAKARGSCITDTDSDQSDSLDKRSINEAHHNTSANKINLNRSRSIQRQRLAAYSTAMESIQAESEPIDEEDDVPSGGIPARNAKGERLLLFIGIIDILQSYRLKKKLEHSIKAMLTDGDTVSVHRPGFYAQRFQDFMATTVFKKIPSLDLPEIKGPHRKFRTLVSSYMALKHSPSKRKSAFARMRPSSTNESNELSKHTEMSQSKTSSVAAAATTDIKDAASTTLTSSTTSATNTVTAVSSSIITPTTTTTTTAASATETTEIATNNEGVKSFQANFSHLPSLHHQHQNILKSKHNTDSAPCLRTVVIKQAASKQCVNLNDKMDSISISQINFQSDSTCSVTSSSSGTSTLRTIAWTPPLSVEGSTPTHTEGTPSLTESSESEYAYPTTPLRSVSRRSQASSHCSDGGDNLDEASAEMSEAYRAPMESSLSPIIEDNEKETKRLLIDEEKLEEASETNLANNENNFLSNHNDDDNGLG